ncbi:MAG: T9SS type A sorting domain-containing protein [Ignavibacteria bacterium]|nr:T9SS type A sorting domain-containing protein [Ignavibacteria bacterium]
MLILTCPQFSISQWIQQTSGVSVDLYGVQILNNNTGWVCGQAGVLLKTTNNGNNWVIFNSGTTQTLSDIQFINENTGWISARIGGKVFKTTNGGVNWVTQLQTVQSITAIQFINSNTGWACDLGGNVFRTINGGNSWDSVDVNFSLQDIIFINNDTGWVCGNTTYIYKTTDGGINWKWQHGGSFGGAFTSISFIDNNNGWALNLELYRLYKTTNSGNNWILSDSLTDCFNAHDIFFTSLNTGYVSGDCGQMFKTTNSGLNWYQQITGTNAFRSSAFFLNDTVGWSVGGNGVIIKTINGGAFVKVTSNYEVIPQDFKLHQNYPNPFNPETKIKFELPKSEFVEIGIYDITGKLISKILNKYLTAGIYEINVSLNNFSSGLYICKLFTLNYSSSILMTLIK